MTILICSCKPNKTNPGKEADIDKTDEWVSYKATTNVKGKHIVLVSGDEEYRSEEALPQLAKILTERHGFDCTVLFAQDPDLPGIINPNYRFNIPGLHQLNDADLVIWFTRFRELPSEQMTYFEKFLKRGAPLIAIRTATHAFNFKDKSNPFVHYGWNYEGEKKEWYLGFGKRILGETWYTHHGNHKQQSTRGVISEGMENHPILNGIGDGNIWGATDVYGVREPFENDVTVLLRGKTIQRTANYDENDLYYGMRETDTIAAGMAGNSNAPYDPNAKKPPIVWLSEYQIKEGNMGKAFTSTIGAATDLLDEEVRRLFINASYYLLGENVPEGANVETVGDYMPSQFGFHDDLHWKDLNLKVSDFR